MDNDEMERRITALIREVNRLRKRVDALEKLLAQR